jgi:hypothetical protein
VLEKCTQRCPLRRSLAADGVTDRVWVSR